MQLTINLHGTESDSDLRRLARAIEALQAAPTTTKVGEISMEVHVDTAQAVAALDKLVEHPALAAGPTVELEEVLSPAEVRDIVGYAGHTPVPETVHAHVTNAVPGQAKVVEAPSSDPATDAKGFPWDERIHSSSRKFNADGTWRYRKNVSDDMKQGIEAELRALIGGVKFDPPPAPGNYSDDPVLDAALQKDAQYIRDMGGDPGPTMQDFGMTPHVPPPAPDVPPVPPAPPAAPPVPSTLSRSYSDVVNLIMGRKIPPEVFVAILGADLPTFANVCRTDPNAATKAFNELDHASRT